MAGIRVRVAHRVGLLFDGGRPLRRATCAILLPGPLFIVPARGMHSLLFIAASLLAPHGSPPVQLGQSENSLHGPSLKDKARSSGIYLAARRAFTEGRRPGLPRKGSAPSVC